MDNPAAAYSQGHQKHQATMNGTMHNQCWALVALTKPIVALMCSSKPKRQDHHWPKIPPNDTLSIVVDKLRLLRHACDALPRSVLPCSRNACDALPRSVPHCQGHVCDSPTGVLFRLWSICGPVVVDLGRFAKGVKRYFLVVVDLWYRCGRFWSFCKRGP